jgi:hypothetical protein
MVVVVVSAAFLCVSIHAGVQQSCGNGYLESESCPCRLNEAFGTEHFVVENFRQTMLRNTGRRGLRIASKEHSVIIFSGSPGIGKSLFGLLFMADIVQKIREKRQQVGSMASHMSCISM